ncbi:MAG: glycoside hydrolase family 71/99-like protein [Verrucomicrobiota bacterium]
MNLKLLLGLALCVGLIPAASAASKHAKESRWDNCEKLVMAGYQGWFRGDGKDGTKAPWQQWGKSSQIDDEHMAVDQWPDMTEYERKYTCPFKLLDGSPATVFSSLDASTTDLHCRWMREYGIDAMAFQRFYWMLKKNDHRDGDALKVLKNCLESTKKEGRAFMLMYDLSNYSQDEDHAEVLIRDFKRLVDDYQMTGGQKTHYLYYQGKPLVCLWGIGHGGKKGSGPHRYEVKKFIEFLKHDPEYGNCAIMLGVPCYFAERKYDCSSAKELTEIFALADIFSPWNGGRYATTDNDFLGVYGETFGERLAKDLAYCKSKHQEYAPTVYPGFSWYNAMRTGEGLDGPFGAIPRRKGHCYWGLWERVVKAGCRIVFIGMFDEFNESTAIMKSTDNTPALVKSKYIPTENMGADHYLWLTQQAVQMFKAGKQLPEVMPVRPGAKQLPMEWGQSINRQVKGQRK